MEKAVKILKFIIRFEFQTIVINYTGLINKKNRFHKTYTDLLNLFMQLKQLAFRSLN